MDFTGISLASGISQVLAFGLIVVSAYAVLWAVMKVISLIKYDSISYSNSTTFEDNPNDIPFD